MRLVNLYLRITGGIEVPLIAIWSSEYGQSWRLIRAHGLFIGPLNILNSRLRARKRSVHRHSTHCYRRRRFHASSCGQKNWTWKVGKPLICHVVNAMTLLTNVYVYWTRYARQPHRCTRTTYECKQDLFTTITTSCSLWTYVCFLILPFFQIELDIDR